MDINDDGIGEVFASCGPESGTGGHAWRCFVKGQKGYVEVFNFLGSVVAFVGKKNGFQVLKTYSRSGGGEGSLTTWTWNSSMYVETESQKIYPDRDGYWDDEGNWILKKGEQKPVFAGDWEFSQNAWEDKPVWEPRSERK
jgi:hypothetical protein